MRPLTKWNHVGTSIFTVMTQKAMAAGAVNLAQGFPDFDGPEVIKDAAIAAIRTGLNQYAPAPGLPALRQALARRQAQRTGLSFDWEREVTVFSGATEAIYCAMQALLTAGDEVIALEPAYDSYGPAAYAAGAKLVGVPLKAPDWTLDASRLAQAITPKTRAMIINTPHNPTGRVFSRDELQVIRELAIKHDLWVITDEVYEELVYGTARHVSLATLPGMAERTVTISSTSKTYSFTGWKVGYAFAPEPLTQALRAVHQFTVFCSATPLQAGMVAALGLGDDYYRELVDDYGAKREQLVALLRQVGFKVSAPSGTYFTVADYSGLKQGHLDDRNFATWLTETVRVAAVPVSVFYQDQEAARTQGRHVRFAFCKSQETIAEAGRRLAAGLLGSP